MNNTYLGEIAPKNYSSVTINLQRTQAGMTVTQRKALLYITLSAVGLIILALGMPSLRLEPGLPIPGAVDSLPPTPLPSGSGSASEEVPIGWLLQGGLSVGFVLLLTLLVISMFRKARMKLILEITFGLLAVLALLLVLPPLLNVLKVTLVGESVYNPPPQQNYQVAPIGTPPANLYGIVVVVVLLAALLASGWLLKEFLRKPKPENPLAIETEAALRALESGQDFRNVIVRCYLNMIQVLKDERGIERQASVTPREFEGWLSSQGVPDVPINQLTRLFEKARYSDQLPGSRDEQVAMECLSAISMYCRRGKTQT